MAGTPQYKPCNYCGKYISSWNSKTSCIASVANFAVFLATKYGIGKPTNDAILSTNKLT
jgi:hypothetical protein